MSSFGNRGNTESTQNRPASVKAYDNRWKVTLKMQPGESIVGRIVVGPEWPLQYQRHSHAETGMGEYNTICGRPNQCLLCDAITAADVWYGRNRRSAALGGAKPGDYVKFASARAVFGFVSTRTMFKVPDGDKIKMVPRIVDSQGRPCRAVRNAPIQPYTDGRHEFDGVFEFGYEGLVALDLGNSKKKAQTKPIFDAEDALSTECRCGAKLADGIRQRPARVIRDMGGAIIGCEANCGSPSVWSVGDMWVQITRTGEGVDLDYDMQFFPPTGPIPDEYRSIFYDESGAPRQLDVSSFKAERSLQENVLRALSPNLSRFGVNVDAIISGQSGQVMAQAQGQQVFNGMTQFGGTPAPQAPRVAAPASAFPSPGVVPVGPPRENAVAVGMPVTTSAPTSTVLTAGPGFPPRVSIPRP